MVTRRQIRAYAAEIAREFRPRRIILFGSYAYGKPTRDSDVDLLVIMPHKGCGADKATEIRLRVRAPFPMDLLVRSPQKIRQRLAWGDCFVQEVLDRGEVLYEGSRSSGNGRPCGRCRRRGRETVAEL
jgi:predicted nucleotidyltransferase